MRVPRTVLSRTRFDPQSEPAGSAWAERATSRLGRAAASRGHLMPGAVTPGPGKIDLGRDPRRAGRAQPRPQIGTVAA
jgi:hypothetical protein